LGLEEATRLTVKCLATALEARQLPPRMKVAIVPSDLKKMQVLSDRRIEELLKEQGLGK
jgi:20S proteasome alpha/beta subunit